MSQSTPINMIRRGDQPVDSNQQANTSPYSSNSDSQLVEDILKEMGESPGGEQQSNINSQAYQYAMDSSQVAMFVNNNSSPASIKMIDDKKGEVIDEVNYIAMPIRNS